jgi:hypothetical protein
MVLCRDLGRAINIRPAMTRKILKANVKVVYRLTVQLLTPDKKADKTMTKERERFKDLVEKLLGDSFKYEDFSNDLELKDLDTPSFEPYGDDKKEAPSGFPDNDDNNADPDAYVVYVGSKVELPIGNAMMNAKVRGRKRRST